MTRTLFALYEQRLLRPGRTRPTPDEHDRVLIIAICAAVAAAGLVLVARHTRAAPPALPPARYVLVCLGAGRAGLIAAGAGGRS